MKKSIVMVAGFVLLGVVVSGYACEHLKPTSSPVPVVKMRDVNTGQEQDLMAEYKDQVKLVAFGNLKDPNFVADIKALNKLATSDQGALKRVIVIMDTKDAEEIKKFIAENEIKIRMVVPVEDGWQKNWPGVVNRAVFIADQQNIVARGVDFIGNENLIKETTDKLLKGSS